MKTGSSKSSNHVSAPKVIRFCLSGVTGKMGREAVRASQRWQGIELVSATGMKHAGHSLRDLFSGDVPDIQVGGNLDRELKAKPVDVLLDLTRPDAALANALCAIENGVAPVIGTTGLNSEDIEKIEVASNSAGIPAMLIPNFSVGAVLGMKFSELAAKWIPDVEIIEMHHDQKIDAPSGTALETAKVIQRGRMESKIQDRSLSSAVVNPVIKVPGVRGGKFGDIPIHSVRLKGILAQQSVLFGAPGETLEIKHTVIDRSTYMGGIELCLRSIWSQKGFTLGLDSLLWPS